MCLGNVNNGAQFAPIHIINLRWEHKQWHSPVYLVAERVLAVPLSLGGCFISENWFLSLVVWLPFKLSFYSVPQVRWIWAPVSQWYPSLLQGCVGGGDPSITMVCLLPFFMWSFYPLLCRSCSLRPPFFLGKSCFVCRCRIGVYVGGAGLRLFLCCHLHPPQHPGFWDVWFLHYAPYHVVRVWGV